MLENLIVYATYFDIPTRVARRRAEQLLSFFQLEEKAHVHVDKLSGGMRRRLMIARSLINEPKLIILDEPTTGLDPQARHVVWSGLRELKQQGITLLLTTHYMEEAAQLCDRLLMLDRGKELSRGTPDELIARHAGGGVVELWYVDAARRQYLLDSLQGEEGVRKWEISGELLLIFCDSFSVAEQLGKRLYQSLPPQAMARYRPANLEDVFLSLAGRGIDVEGAQ